MDANRLAFLLRASALEEAAQIADRLAGYMENGAGEINPGERLRQASRLIRELATKPREHSGLNREKHE